MNYRHAYHVGNFADVLKHITLALIIDHLKLKPQPFRVIDVHAGVGRYDLSSIEATKTGEWRDGIGRVLAAELPDDVRKILGPYLDTVAAVNAAGAQPASDDGVTLGNPDTVKRPLTVYPGSPLLARHLMRPGDQLVANELHPEDHAALKAVFHKVRDTKILHLDAWVALKSLLPPPERRGVILIDPPFELAGEFDRLSEGLAEALKRFATGIYVIWYPLKDAAAAARLLARVQGIGVRHALNIKLAVRAPDGRSSGAVRGTISDDGASGLAATGVIVVNPPWRLKADLAAVLPALTQALATAAGASFDIEDIGQP